LLLSDPAALPFLSVLACKGAGGCCARLWTGPEPSGAKQTVIALESVAAAGVDSFGRCQGVASTSSCPTCASALRNRAPLRCSHFDIPPFNSTEEYPLTGECPGDADPAPGAGAVSAFDAAAAQACILNKDIEPFLELGVESVTSFGFAPLVLFVAVLALSLLVKCIRVQRRPQAKFVLIAVALGAELAVGALELYQMSKELSHFKGARLSARRRLECMTSNGWRGQAGCASLAPAFTVLLMCTLAVSVLFLMYDSLADAALASRRLVSAAPPSSSSKAAGLRGPGPAVLPLLGGASMFAAAACVALVAMRGEPGLTGDCSVREDGSVACTTPGADLSNFADGGAWCKSREEVARPTEGKSVTACVLSATIADVSVSPELMNELLALVTTYAKQARICLRERPTLCLAAAILAAKVLVLCAHAVVRGKGRVVRLIALLAAALVLSVEAAVAIVHRRDSIFAERVGLESHTCGCGYGAGALAQLPAYSRVIRLNPHWLGAGLATLGVFVLRLYFDEAGESSGQVHVGEAADAPDDVGGH
jgi:hypothetical protein